MRWVAAVAVLVAGCGGAPFTMALEFDGGAAPLDQGVAGDGDAGHPAVEAGPDASEDRGDRAVVSEAAAPEAAPDAPAEATAPACVTDLSGVGTGDFRIAFTVSTTETGLTLALLNQRSGCTTSMLWDITLSASGLIVAQIDDGVASHNVVIEPSTVVNDGQLHKVVLARVGGQAWCSIDGAISNSMGSNMTAAAYSYGIFPALSVGTDPCQLTPSSGRASLIDICITKQYR